MNQNQTSCQEKKIMASQFLILFQIMPLIIYTDSNTDKAVNMQLDDTKLLCHLKQKTKKHEAPNILINRIPLIITAFVFSLPDLLNKHGVLWSEITQLARYAKLESSF